MKNKEIVQRDILRFVVSQVKNKKIELQKEPTDNQIIKIMQKEIKQIKETIESLHQSWDASAIETELLKIKTLEVYLPVTLTEEELKNILTDTIKTLWIESPKQNRWPIIGSIMSTYGAKVDWSMLNTLINWL